MSYISLFWKYYQIMLDRLENIRPEEGQDNLQISAAVVEGVVPEMENFKGEIQNYCKKHCRLCQDHLKNCKFFYTMVVFGDELIIQKFGHGDPALERHYFGTGVGGENVLKEMEELAKKGKWTAQELEFARIYYYMLFKGFQDKAIDAYAQVRGRTMELLEHNLYSPDHRENLTPDIYKSIQECEKFTWLPSLTESTLWALCVLIGLVVTLNVIWYFYTDSIRDNLLQILTEVTPQKVNLFWPK